MTAIPATGGGLGLRSERGPILLAIMISISLVALDGTILAAAVPTIVGELGGFEQFPWLFSSYLLASSVTVPISAKLADVLGRRPVLLWGIGVFLIGSLLCTVAWSMPMLIAARAVQGIGAGVVQPLATTIMGDIYTLPERARTQGYIAGVWAVASVLGPAIGASMSQLGAWRVVFVVNLPLCALATWLITRNYREHIDRRAHRIDYAGAATLAAGAGLLMLGLLESGHVWPWGSPGSTAVFAGGAVLLLAFVVIERRAAEPVLPLSLLRRPFLGPAAVVNFAISGCMIGLTAFVPTYLQVGAGAAPLVSGAALAGFSVGWPVAGFTSGAVYMRYGFRATAVIGAGIATAATVVLIVIAGTPAAWSVALACFFVGLGVGCAAVPSLVGAQSSVDWKERGVASGLVMFSRSLGQSAAVAVLGAVSNAAILAAGGSETDPATIIGATRLVFVGSCALAVVVLVGSLFLPRRLVEGPPSMPAAPV